MRPPIINVFRPLLLFLQGYVECTRQIVSTTRWIASELRRVEGVRVVGSPDVSVVAIGSDGSFNVYSLSEQLRKRGECRVSGPRAAHAAVARCPKSKWRSSSS